MMWKCFHGLKNKCRKEKNVHTYLYIFICAHTLKKQITKFYILYLGMELS